MLGQSSFRHSSRNEPLKVSTKLLSVGLLGLLKSSHTPWWYAPTCPMAPSSLETDVSEKPGRSRPSSIFLTVEQETSLTRSAVNGPRASRTSFPEVRVGAVTMVKEHRGSTCDFKGRRLVVPLQTYRPAEPKSHIRSVSVQPVRVRHGTIGDKHL